LRSWIGHPNITCSSDGPCFCVSWQFLTTPTSC
jgi:hypothetical protein